MYKSLLRITYKLEQNTLFSAIKKGLLTLTPILLTGSIALMLRSLPFPLLRAFLEQAAGGLLMRVLDLTYDATFGFMAIYLVCGISYSYASTFREEDETFRLMAMMTSIGCFIASFGADLGSFAFKDFGAVGAFSAIFCALLGTALFSWLVRTLPRWVHTYSAGADRSYRAVIPMIVPFALCVLVFAVLSILIQSFTGHQNLNDLAASAVVGLFQNLPNELASGVLFVLLLDGFWFFGMHGGNLMEQVAQSYLVPANAEPGTIVCKSFLDTFVLMGGCGATLCLLLALLLCSRNKSNRKLAWSAAPFALFNINELLVFGLPVILNPVLLVPFLLTPLLSLMIAYAATLAGLLPVITQSITWTTPVLFSGYAASGSVNGVLVQLLILAAGTALYIPFVRLSDRMQTAHERMMLEELDHLYWQESGTAQAGGYLGRPGRIGAVAKAMAGQLRLDAMAGEIPVCYQPQMDSKGTTVGAEALLRWRYHGHAVSPPLAVALAQEDGVYNRMTDCILERAATDAARFSHAAEGDFIVSVNVTAGQIDNPDFIAGVTALTQRTGVAGRLCLEITEEEALDRYDRIEAHLKRLYQAGISAAIDDFSMGHTSLRYLQNNGFQFVKLDGGLVRQLPDNSRCRDIVRSIISLGGDLGFTVVAEYVESEALRQLLLELGCQVFQGYLYSPAIPAGEFEQWIRAH